MNVAMVTNWYPINFSRTFLANDGCKIGVYQENCVDELLRILWRIDHTRPLFRSFLPFQQRHFYDIKSEKIYLVSGGAGLEPVTFWSWVSCNYHLTRLPICLSSTSPLMYERSKLKGNLHLHFIIKKWDE